MEPSVNPSLLLMAVLIVLAIFYLSVSASLFPHVFRLYRFIARKIHEYQALDRGDFLTLLIDAGLTHEQSQWFYDKFYAHGKCWERCLIKLYIKKHYF